MAILWRQGNMKSPVFLHYITLLILRCNLDKTHQSLYGIKPEFPLIKCSDTAYGTGLLNWPGQGQEVIASVRQESKKSVHHCKAAVFCQAFGGHNSCDHRAFCCFISQSARHCLGGPETDGTAGSLRCFTEYDS